MSDVFISYSRLDKGFVGSLRDALAREKQDIWIDWESIPPSQAWWDEIRKGIARANNFVVVLSPNSMASPICQMEIEYARQLGKRIIPVLHLDFSRDDAIRAIATRLASPDQDAARTIWGNRQPHTLFDGNDSVLKHINYFFFRPGDDFETRFAALLEVIRTDYAHKEQHTRLQLRAEEWERRGGDASFVLLDAELKGAQAWLLESTGKQPEPTPLQRAYIDASARRTRQLRGIQRTSVVGSIAAVIAIILAIGASLLGANAAQQLANVPPTLTRVGEIVVDALGRADTAGTQVADANATLTPIPLTLTAAAEQVFAAATARGDAESRAAAADTQVANATATLGIVQAQGTEVAAQATYFGIEQARIGTLSAGAVVIPPGTLTPELLLPTLTAIAQLRQWEQRVISEEIEGVKIQMVEVPPGCFMMGSVAGGDEVPINEQCFTEPFYIDRYEVTQAQFTALDGEMSRGFTYPGDNRPVETINWFEARDFCARRGARLPTEREWEYAARGPDSLTYPWGNIFVPENAVTNRVESQGTADVIDAAGNPARPNGASWVGALDMSGNVFEWTSTRYDDLDYSKNTLNYQGLFLYPYDPEDGREADETRADFDQRLSEQKFFALRVVRGSSWGYLDSFLRGAARYRYSPALGTDLNGFRCARSR